MNIHYYELHISILACCPYESAKERLQKILPTGWKVPLLQTRQGDGVVDIVTARALSLESAHSMLITGIVALANGGHSILRSKIEAVVFDTRQGDTVAKEPTP